jgi:hypothetical protein
VNVCVLAQLWRRGQAEQAAQLSFLLSIWSSLAAAVVRLTVAVVVLAV